MKLVRYARNVLIGLLVTALVAYGSYRQWGQPDLNFKKLAWFREHKHDFNILFFGSSVSLQNVAPRAFDEVLSREGYASSSFSFGIAGADMHQIDWAIRAALELNPDNVKYIFIDLRPFEMTISPRHQLTPPMIRWHDPYQTLSAFRTVDLADAPPFEKSEAREIHRRHFLYKYVPVGIVIAPPLESEEKDFDPALRGYAPYTPDDEKAARQHESFLENLPDYFEGVERKRRQEYDPFDFQHYNLEALRAQIEFIQARGITPVYWTAPSTHSYDFANALRQNGELPHLLSFDNAERFGDLYDQALRMDHNHLNNEGTRRFMPILAGAFLDHFEGKLDLPPSGPGPAAKSAPAPLDSARP